MSEQGLSVLVVDDSLDIATMVSLVLEAKGFETAVAVSAGEALSLARTRPFDIVISDIGMPEMDGYELAKILRSLPGYETVG